VDTECYIFSYDLSFTLTDGSSEKKCCVQACSMNNTKTSMFTFPKTSAIVNGVKIIKKKDVERYVFLTLIFHVILLCSLD